MSKILKLGSGLPVEGLRAALLANPELWDQNQARTQDPDSAHFGLSDIWVRFSPPGSGANQPHESVWYPPEEVLQTESLFSDLYAALDGEQLGGILITRIPAGATCRPHIDNGWHAKRYEKFAYQIEADEGQSFCFDGESLVTKQGDLFWFDNSHKHWVLNPTTNDRITLIVCIKTPVMDRYKDKP